MAKMETIRFARPYRRWGNSIDSGKRTKSALSTNTRSKSCACKPLSL